MSKALRNDLFRAVEAGGLNTADVELSRLDDTGQELIEHKRSGSRITFGFIRPDQYFMDSIVGTDDTSHPELEYSPNWEDVLTSVRRWAERVKEWDVVPDLWAAGFNQEDLLAPETDLDNAPFSPDERDEISLRIDEIKRQAREIGELSAEQIARIDEKLDYLKAASERVGRKDWRIMLYGLGLGMIANDLVPQHVVETIITMTIHGLGHIFGLGGLPPALPPQ